MSSSYGVEALLKQRADIDSELRKQKSPVTVMFTDLAGSTSYFEKYGDTAGVDWLDKHNKIVIPEVQAHGGIVVKTIGDSVMAYFNDAVRAVTAGRVIQQKLFEKNAQLAAESQMHVRVALHHGLGYLKGGDVFGDVVNVAARIAKACLPAQVLISEAVYHAAQSGAFEFTAVDAVQFHGKSSKENLFEVMWTDAETYAELRRKFPGKPQKAQAQEALPEGRYQVLNELGRGAMGVVYKAYDRLIGRVVAMKTIPIEVGDDADKQALIDRLKQEARTAGILDHPNIITVFDVGEEAGIFYFTMQYVEGRALSDILREKELLPFNKLLEFADQICGAVGFAHKAGIIHRDLKPSNLMHTKQGAIKVLDFGIAKFGDAGLTKAGMVVGTPSYMAPEQAAGKRIDLRADIFSLGAIFYELFTGERAFSGDSTTAIIYKVLNEDPIPPSVIEPTLPPSIDYIIRRALMKDPHKRFQTCEEMREAFKNQALLSSLPANMKETFVVSPNTPPRAPAAPAPPTATQLEAPPQASRSGKMPASGTEKMSATGKVSATGKMARTGTRMQAIPRGERTGSLEIEPVYDEAGEIASDFELPPQPESSPIWKYGAIGAAIAVVGLLAYTFWPAKTAPSAPPAQATQQAAPAPAPTAPTVTQPAATQPAQPTASTPTPAPATRAAERPAPAATSPSAPPPSAPAAVARASNLAAARRAAIAERVQGRPLRQRLTDLRNDPEFQRLSPDEKKQLLDEVFPAFRQMTPQQQMNALARATEDKQERQTDRAQAKEEKADTPAASDDSMPYDTETLLAIANRYAGNGNYKLAIATFNQVLRREPRNAAAREGLQKALDAQKLQR